MAKQQADQLFLACVDAVTIEDQIAELKREMHLRDHVYPKMVASGKLKANDAQMQKIRLQACIDTLQSIQNQVPGR